MTSCCETCLHFTKDNNQSQHKQKAVIHSNALLTSQRMRAQHKQFINGSRLNLALRSLTPGQPLPSAVFAEPFAFVSPWPVCAHTDLRLNISEKEEHFLALSLFTGRALKGLKCSSLLD